MNVIISNSSGQPIYEQIVAQIKTQIMTGALQEGAALPSMRLLAKELRISVITTKRAYEELERDGFIQTMTGKGSFVAPRDLELIREENLRIAQTHLQRAVDVARTGGIAQEELTELLALLYEEE